MVLQHLIALVSALFKSLRYHRRLRIRSSEKKGYYAKSLNLALCYVGFADSWKLHEAWRAGEAAFFCCAYDVVTDWRAFDSEARRSFEEILRQECLDPEIPCIALDLYYAEKGRRLEDDGLSRGAVSLRLILKLMGCEQARENAWGDLDHLGRLCQIVDDVLDFEQDVEADHLNCLRSSSREIYLLTLISELDAERVSDLFGNRARVLNWAIGKARLKAIRLLAQGNSRESGSQAHLSGPSHIAKVSL